MKTRVCFRLFAVAGAAVMAGCDLDDSATTEGLSSCTDGAPRSAEVEYDTFEISGEASENPENASLERTLFRNFERITAPADSTDNADAADEAYRFFAEQTESFAGFNADDLPGYQSVRNGFDLLEAMIASGNIGALQEARDAMANCVREDAPGSLRVDPVQVTEKAEDENDDPDTWTLGVNYAHNPEPLTDPTPFGPNIARVAFTPDSFVFTLYPNDSFEGIGPSSGFKQPSKLIAGFNAAFEASLEDEGSEEQQTDDETRPSVIFESFVANTQDDRGDERGETDRWSWSSEDAVDTFEDVSDVEEARCVRITADYSDEASGERILVELASETCPSISSPEDFEADDSFRYTSNDPDRAQTRD